MPVGAKGTLRILALDLMIIAAIIIVLMSVVAFGIELPENLNSTLEMNLTTAFLIVVLAPVLEEIVFRSWLSGRPAILSALAILVAGLVLGPLVAGIFFPPTEGGLGLGATLTILVGLLIAVVGAITAAIMLRGRPAPSWFAALFPAFFWLSCVAFALIHLLNYTEGTLAILLPLLIPQFILGTLAAYVRVHYGLIFAIALHAAHNGFALGVAALAMQAGAA